MTTLAFAARFSWVCELFSHFRAQYAALLALCAFAAILLRRRDAGLVFLSAGILNAVLLTPLLLGRPAPGPDGRPTLTGMHFNINNRLGLSSEIAERIAESDPDLLLLCELSDARLNDLAPVLSRFPYRRTAPRNDNYGIGLFSRFPLQDAAVFSTPGSGLPNIRATVVVGDRHLQVIGTHPPPPKSRALAAHRNRQLESLARHVRQDHPAILVGDLNMTPWSPYFSKLLAKTSLRNSMRGFGLQGTWPAASTWWRIPIDHVLVSPHIHMLERSVGRAAGSDHLPLLFTLAFD